MFDETLIKPRNMCKHTALEKLVWHTFGKAVKVFKCKESGKFRLVAHDSLGEPVSGLLINPYTRVRTYQIDGVYTSDSYRRLGYAKQLLAIARHMFGTVKHSDNLTVDGKAWRNSVEGLKC